MANELPDDVIMVTTTYELEFQNRVKLPDGVKAKDVKTIEQKYDNVTIFMKDGSTLKYEMDHNLHDAACGIQHPDEITHRTPAQYCGNEYLERYFHNLEHEEIDLSSPAQSTGFGR